MAQAYHGQCCSPDPGRPSRKIYKDGDVLHAEAKLFVPVAQNTALARFSECVLAHNCLRKSANKVEKTISGDGVSLIKSKENVKETKLLPSRDYTKKFATYTNLKAFATIAVLPGVVKLNNACDNVRILALTSLLFFTGARPGGCVVAAGYDHDDSTLGLQWKDCEFFVQKLGGKVQPGVRVTLRNPKCHKEDQNKFRRVVFLARDSLPAAADQAVLLYTLALMDSALEDVEEVADLQTFSAAPMNDVSKRVDLEIKPELQGLAVFRRIEQAGVAAPWVMSERPLNVDLANKVFGKIRPYCCPSLVFYDFRRGAAAALNRPGITSEDAKLGMGHCTGSEVRTSAYLPKTASYDLTGLLVDGIEDRETVQWLGNEDLPYEPLSSAEEAQLRLYPEYLQAVAEEKAKAHDCVTAKGRLSDAQKAKTPEFLHFMEISRRTTTLLSKLRKSQQQDKAKEAVKQMRQTNADVTKVVAAGPVGGGDDGKDDGDDEADAEDGAALDAHLQEVRRQQITGSNGTAEHAAHPSERIQAVLSQPASNARWVKELEGLKRDISKQFDLSVPDLTPLLKTGSEKPSLTAAYGLLLEEVGTQRAVQLEDACPTCNKTFKSSQSLADRKRHSQSCQAKAILACLEENTFLLMQKRGCPWSGCQTKWTKKHSKHTVEKHLYQCHPDQRAVCGLETDDGDVCQFSGGNEDLDSMDTALLTIHREVAHGWPGPPNRSLYFDAAENRFILGYTEVQLHCAAKCPADDETLTSTTASLPTEVCPVCFMDPHVAPLCRLEPINGTMIHLWVHHLLKPTQQYDAPDKIVLRCCCIDSMAVPEIFEHLQPAGFSILKLQSKSVDDSADTLEGLRDAGPHYAEALKA